MLKALTFTQPLYPDLFRKYSYIGINTKNYWSRFRSEMNVCVSRRDWRTERKTAIETYTKASMSLINRFLKIQIVNPLVNKWRYSKNVVFILLLLPCSCHSPTLTKQCSICSPPVPARLTHLCHLQFKLFPATDDPPVYLKLCQYMSNFHSMSVLDLTFSTLFLHK